MRIVIVGKKEQDLYLIGHNTNVAYDFIGQNQAQLSLLKFVDTIQDCACSLIIRYILHASIRLMGDPLLRMALLWIPALQQALVVLIGLQTFLSGARMLCRGRPKQPTNGIISAFLVFMTVIGIFSIITGKTCWNILGTNQRTISLPSEGDISSSCEENIGSSISKGDTRLRLSFSSEGDFTQTCYLCSCESES
jgi:hypothetical protein